MTFQYVYKGKLNIEWENDCDIKDSFQHNLNILQNSHSPDFSSCFPLTTKVVFDNVAFYFE